jgi:hypothetical protein
MYQQYQTDGLMCDAFFPSINQLPAGKGTNAKLVFRASGPIIPLVTQIFGSNQALGGGPQGSVGSQAVFQDINDQ